MFYLYEFPVSPVRRWIRDYADAYWDSLFYNLRDVAWEDIFKVGAIAAAAATDFCELVVDV